MVSDHEQRLSDLEKWQDQVNRNIASLQRLLNTTDYITAVTPLMEGGEEVGYTISFLNSDPINIYHGKKGDEGDKGEPGEQGDDGHTPQIGLTQGTDGNWYWTLDGELMLDKDNNPIRANGEDGQQGQQGQPGQSGASTPTPQIKLGSTLDTNAAVITDNGEVQPAAWYLSVDGGQTWYRITSDKGEPGDEGDKGDKGDSMFADDPITEEGNYYIFHLADGKTTFSIPKYQALTIGDGTGVLELAARTDEIKITLPAGTTADDYRALVAQITPEGADGTYTDIDTRADDANGWSVTANLQAQTVTVTAGGGNALLRVTLIRNDGSELTASRIVSLSHVIDETTKIYTVYTPQGLLAWANDFFDYNCTLAADIDMSGQTWRGIGGFEHTFDGAGHIIRNLNTTNGFIESFRYEGTGTVKNLLLVDADISCDKNAGGIAGNLSNGRVIACAVSGCTVKGKSPVGGIAGDTRSASSVTACYAASCTVEGQNSFGHIAGEVHGSINACYYDGDGEGVGFSATGASVSATRVDNANGWQAAAQDMNSQLAGNDYIWEVNPDEKARATLPLVLVPNPDVQ